MFPTLKFGYDKMINGFGIYQLQYSGKKPINLRKDIVCDKNATVVQWVHNYATQKLNCHGLTNGNLIS